MMKKGRLRIVNQEKGIPREGRVFCDVQQSGSLTDYWMMDVVGSYVV
jgi:hypothetical protein